MAIVIVTRCTKEFSRGDESRHYKTTIRQEIRLNKPEPYANQVWPIIGSDCVQNDGARVNDCFGIDWSESL